MSTPRTVNAEYVGKTVEEVYEQDLTARDTYKDEMSGIRTTIRFTDGTHLEIDSVGPEVYDVEVVEDGSWEEVDA